MNKDLQEAIAYAKKKAEELTIKSNELYKENYEESSKCQEHADEYERFISLLTELQERREADRWIPISETLPDESDWYLVTRIFKNGKDVVKAFFSKNTKCFYEDACTPFKNVTAWKPLPKSYDSEA